MYALYCNTSPHTYFQTRFVTKMRTDVHTIKKQFDLSNTAIDITVIIVIIITVVAPLDIRLSSGCVGVSVHP